MGPLLMLTSTVLCSYLVSGSSVHIQKPHTSVFQIGSVDMSFEPGSDVPRNTNVTLRCKAMVISQGSEVLTRNYTISKDESTVYHKTTSSTEDLLYQLPEVRVSDSGNYKCQINIKDKHSSSRGKNLNVTGLSKPVLQLIKTVITEGEEVTAWCTALGERGPILFYFYDGAEEIHRMRLNSNMAKVELKLSAGDHEIHCIYTMFTTSEAFKSEESGKVRVVVTELRIKPTLEITPQDGIIEGDHLNITCTVENHLYRSENMELYLSQNTSLLNIGRTFASHNMTAQTATAGLMFVCRLRVRNVDKVRNKTVSVTELFSEPTLTMTPSEVFQGDFMTLTCKSERVNSERLNWNSLTYTLQPTEKFLTSLGNGVFRGKPPQNEFNYTCTAKASGIEKHSSILTVSPKVYASIPEISVSGWVILNVPFNIRCHSDTGSLPITYSLKSGDTILKNVTVSHPRGEALFEVTIRYPEELHNFTCEASNGVKKTPPSERLHTTVIVPLSQPRLATLPVLADISEGHDLYLICGVEGTPPVTFRWYRGGEEKPLNTTTSHNQHANYHIPSLSKEHSGMYYCEAVNHANKPVKSDQLHIEVRMSLWKKGVIGGMILLVVVLLVTGCVLYFRSQRVKVNRTSVSVWSERKPGAGDEESSTVSNEPGVEYTEVVHPRSADVTRAPPRKGTDTVYSELQNSSHGSADHHDYGSVEYTELIREQPEISHHHPDTSSYSDLPEPVD